MYYYYYATQVVHFYEGPDWHKFWNPQDARPAASTCSEGRGRRLRGAAGTRTRGSSGQPCGRLGTTCLALLTLEVYYRHLPLYKRDSGGLAESREVRRIESQT